MSLTGRGCGLGGRCFCCCRRSGPELVSSSLLVNSAAVCQECPRSDAAERRAVRAEFLREKPDIGDMENEFKSIDEENRWSPLYGVSMDCVCVYITGSVCPHLSLYKAGQPCHSSSHYSCLIMSNIKAERSL